MQRKRETGGRGRKRPVVGHPSSRQLAPDQPTESSRHLLRLRGAEHSRAEEERGCGRSRRAAQSPPTATSRLSRSADEFVPTAGLISLRLIKFPLLAAANVCSRRKRQRKRGAETLLAAVKLPELIPAAVSARLSPELRFKLGNLPSNPSKHDSRRHETSPSACICLPN